MNIIAFVCMLTLWVLAVRTEVGQKILGWSFMLIGLLGTMTLMGLSLGWSLLLVK